MRGILDAVYMLRLYRGCDSALYACIRVTSVSLPCAAMSCTLSRNCSGPISDAVEPFFGWNDASIALLNNWGPIAYFVAVRCIFSPLDTPLDATVHLWPRMHVPALLQVLPTVWLLDVRGLRTSALVSVR